MVRIFWIFTVNCIEKMKRKEEMPAMAHFLKKQCSSLNKTKTGIIQILADRSNCCPTHCQVPSWSPLTYDDDFFLVFAKVKVAPPGDSFIVYFLSQPLQAANSPVRPDLAKFCHFGNILKALVKFVRVYLFSVWQNFKPSLAILDSIGSILTDVNRQILEK